MKDLAEASKRVSEKKRELDELNRREKKAEELQSFLQRLDADQEVADCAVRFTNFNVFYSEGRSWCYKCS